MNRVLKCDGFEMFHGSFQINPVNGKPPFRKYGDWLHKPTWENDGYDIWYVRPDDGGFSESYDADILSDMEVY